MFFYLSAYRNYALSPAGKNPAQKPALEETMTGKDPPDTGKFMQ